MAGGVAATLLIGAIAGLYPAIRAARLAPTEALATP
jgi:putative ABC transport system permease protein